MMGGPPTGPLGIRTPLRDEVEPIHQLAGEVMLHDVIRDHIKTIAPKDGDIIVLTIPSRHQTPHLMRQIQGMLSQLLEHTPEVRAMILPEGTSATVLSANEVNAALITLRSLGKKIEEMTETLSGANPVLPTPLPEKMRTASIDDFRKIVEEKRHKDEFG